MWIHCASVGEASIPFRLVEWIRSEYPRTDIVFSSCTDTGVERLRELYPGDGVFFFPCDLSFCVNAALERVKPSALLLVEQEIWPNMLLACNRRRIPVAILNGRMNELSSRLVRCLLRLLPQAREAIKLCCARSRTDAGRFEYAGIDGERITETGSLKYEALDTTGNNDSISRLMKTFRIQPGEGVLVGGSTHDREETALADAWRSLRRDHPSLRLVIAPRHIERAGRVAKALRKSGYMAERKTELENRDGAVSQDTVIIVDTIGELVPCYALATVAFVGRSLFPPGGGQNMMEPAALGKAVVVGAHTGNFRPEMEVLCAASAVEVVRNLSELRETLHRLLKNRARARALGRRAQRAVIANRGATRRSVEELEERGIIGAGGGS